MSEERRGRPVADGDVHILSWRAKAEDSVDRHCELLRVWIADADWQPAWQAVVADVARHMEPLPAGMAGRVGGVVDAEDARLLPWTLESGWRASVNSLADLIAARIEIIVAAPPESALPCVELVTPATSAAAREEWLTARTEYSRMRVGVRRAHRKRAELRETLQAGTWRFRYLLVNGWLGAVDGLVGDRSRALEFAEGLLGEALEALEVRP